MVDPANTVQSRVIADTVARATIEEFVRQHPMQPPKAEVPGPLKWAAGIIGAIVVALSVGSATWAVSTLNALQITVARMDERQQRDETGKRLDKIEERLNRLEQKGATT